jgi:hypothetical protein
MVLVGRYAGVGRDPQFVTPHEAGLVSADRSGYFNMYRVDSRVLGLLAERLRELAGRSH